MSCCYPSSGGIGLQHVPPPGNALSTRCASHAQKTLSADYFRNSPSPTELATSMEVGEEAEAEKQEFHIIPTAIRADWFIVLISLQSDIIYNCLVSLTAPGFYFYRRAARVKASVGEAVYGVARNATRGSSVLANRVCAGLLAVLHVSVVLMFVMLLAAAAGVGLVRFYVEEPLEVRESLFFDYSVATPNAVLSFQGGPRNKQRQVVVPVGRTLHVSLFLVMPESDFNRHVGVFQLRAELLSANGDVIVNSSQPRMLHFRSLPLRLTRTLLLGVPHLLGISRETQDMSISILKHKEGYPRTAAVRITLIPRAGTSSPPQLYEAIITISSSPPWIKRMAYNWKWTLYVWTSLYLYVVFLAAVLLCCRPLVFPMSGRRARVLEERKSEGTGLAEGSGREDGAERDVSEMMRRWRQRRSRRKVDLLEKVLSATDTATSSASSTSVSNRLFEDEGVEDSESACAAG